MISTMIFALISCAAIFCCTLYHFSSDNSVRNSIISLMNVKTLSWIWTNAVLLIVNILIDDCKGCCTETDIIDCDDCRILDKIFCWTACEVKCEVACEIVCETACRRDCHCCCCRFACKRWHISVCKTDCRVTYEKDCWAFCSCLL